jgi:NADPH:quinone reductase-like Zn-dependent oxidoreductase
MKAIVQDAYGDSSVLRLDDVPVPRIRAGEVLIKVRATSLNIGDIHLMTGLPLIMRPVLGLRGPRQKVRGMDVAGHVFSVGPGVTDYKVGDPVFGVVEGGLAPYARASVKKIAPLPSSLSFEQASAMPTSGATALHALRDAGSVQAGQKVLIIGASGGVGIFATQIAKSFGAHVTAVASASKLDFVRSLGADEVIDYATDFTDNDFTDGEERYDLIVDMASTHSLEALQRVLTEEGTLVIVGGENGGRFSGGVGRMVVAPLRGVRSKQKLRGLVSATSSADLAALAELVEAGKLAPVIDATALLIEVGDLAHRLETGEALGKLVLTQPRPPAG